MQAFQHNTILLVLSSTQIASEYSLIVLATYYRLIY